MPDNFEIMGGVRPCRGCKEWFVGPAWREPGGSAECLRCRAVPAGSAFAAALEADGRRLSGEHPTGDPYRERRR